LSAVALVPSITALHSLLEMEKWMPVIVPSMTPVAVS
jgi:hypothetical protein